MIICKTIHEIRDSEDKLTSARGQIGFVPTMGALHKGHISLIEQSKKTCKVTVCSIFVNPNQFNDKGDLARYPRTPEADIKMLEDAGCDIVFMPSVEEIYPKDDTRIFEFGAIDKVLDGAHRPGHFNGVAQVVSRLFDIVKPNKAFFGLKDYQQVLVIRKMVEQLKFNIEIVACDILREPDGLAMSSRNTLLSIEERKAASLIPKLMQEAKTLSKTIPLGDVKNKLLAEVSTNPLLKADYIEFCDANTLQTVTEVNAQKTICLAAIFSGKIRLIDNLFIN
ncbi:MAG TPA: pantoate--beta-alanine ligase [Bacteroidia bacterium]|nr:pantoate--beta-alanine ligase [Bacteroidia bacterium]